MICSGSMKIGAGLVGQWRPTGLPVNPIRIFLFCGARATINGMCLSRGMYSDDRPPDASHPQQSVCGTLLTATGPISIEAVGKVVYAADNAGGGHTLDAAITEVADNSFTLTVTINTMTYDAIIQWVATA
jgi:hypothetical protein